MPDSRVPSIHYEEAKHSDFSAIKALLTELQLPAANVGTGNELFIVARDGEVLVGCVGIEVFGKAALLRSLAVVPARQGEGIGSALFKRAMAEALAGGAKAMYLLTTAAEKLFARFGFKPVARDEVPAEVSTSAEFSSPYPASTACMGIRVK